MANGEDLIRRDVAAFQACNWHVKPDAEVFNGIKASIRSQINLAPAVDAVEVVRCKDCEYWKEGIEWEDECECDRFEIKDTDGVTVHALLTPWDWYCADGERRD